MEQGKRRGLRGRKLVESGQLRRLIATIVMASIIAVPSIALATVTSFRSQQAGLVSSGPLLKIYDYQAGSTWTTDSVENFALGTLDINAYLDLLDDAGVPLDKLSLKPAGPDGTLAPDPDVSWWNTDWSQRRCLNIDHTADGSESVTEYQIRVELDVTGLISDGYLQPDMGDLRALSSDASTQLPLWVEPGHDAVWIRVDSIPAGQSQDVCLYYDHQAGDQTPLTVHSEDATFVHSSPKPIYYALSPGLAASSELEVASYLDEVQVGVEGEPAVEFDAGQLITIEGVNSTAPIFTTGPISGRAIGPGFDSLVPISWASTDFIVPVERRPSQRLAVHAPFGDATVTFLEGSDPTPIATILVPSDSTEVVVLPDPTASGLSMLIESDVPVLAFHDLLAGGQSFPLVPLTDNDWLGVSSDSADIGAQLNGTHIDEFRSADVSPTDGDEFNIAVNQGQHQQSASGGPNGGGASAGTVLRLDSTAAIDPEISPVGARFAAVTGGDSDGNEAATFIPLEELNNRYLLTTGSEYVSISCPTMGTEIKITAADGSESVAECSGTETVSWAKDVQDLSVIPSSTVPDPDAPDPATAPHLIVPGTATAVESVDDELFYLYYEDLVTEGESNVLGIKQGRQYTWPEPVVTEQAEGLFPEQGTWLSPEFAIPSGTGVFGGIDFDTATPAGTNVEIQIATDADPDPGDFKGPDGTTSTHFVPDALPSVVDFGHDGDTFARIQVTLTTTDRTRTPLLAAVLLDYNLPLVERNRGIPTSVTVQSNDAPNPETAYLLRVVGSDLVPLPSLASIRLYNSSPQIAGLELRIENVANGTDSAQVGLIIPAGAPVPFDQSQPFSLVGDYSLAGIGTDGSFQGSVQIDLGGDGIMAETAFAVELEDQ